MKIYTSAQLRRLDAYTVEQEGISSWHLMERAVSAFVQVFEEEFETDRPVVVFAGSGNNGGDALGIARQLAQRGYQVEAYVFNIGKGLSVDCERNFQILKELVLPNLTLTEIRSQFTPPHLSAETVVVDGLFGTGLDRPLEGGFAAVVRYLNAAPATVVSVDVPRACSPRRTAGRGRPWR